MWYSTPTCIIYTFTPQRNNPRLDSPFVVGHVAKGRAEFCRPTGRDQYMAARLTKYDIRFVFRSNINVISVVVCNHETQSDAPPIHSHCQKKSTWPVRN